jgi:hypothetical protein
VPKYEVWNEDWSRTDARVYEADSHKAAAEAHAEHCLDYGHIEPMGDGDEFSVFAVLQGADGPVWPVQLTAHLSTTFSAEFDDTGWEV